MVLADGRKEGCYARASGELSSVQLLNSLDTGLAIGENSGVVFGLDDVGAKVFDGGSNAQIFNLTMQPGDLMFAEFSTKEAS